MTTANFEITPADAFRPEEQGLILPSGKRITVVEADVLNLLLVGEGDIPDFITGMVLSQISGTPRPNVKISKESLPELFGFVSTIIMACVTSHKVVKSGANRAAGEINLNDFSSDDKLMIFNVCMPLEAGPARSFRERVEEANMASIRDVESNGHKTEPVPEPAK